jgi:hypothetical protein
MHFGEVAAHLGTYVVQFPVSPGFVQLMRVTGKSYTNVADANGVLARARIPANNTDRPTQLNAPITNIVFIDFIRALPRDPSARDLRSVVGLLQA